MPTHSQIAANQKNAQLSTGPTSETGKAKSSLNAVKTGLTGNTILLPTDDAALYEAHVAQFMTRYAPAADHERNLVQSLADTEWRILRIPSLEMGIYALGRLELAEQFANTPQFAGLDDSVRKQLIETKIHILYQRELKNLSIQEGRLRRQREKDTAALKELQTDRKREAQARLDKVARLYIKAANEDRNDEFDLAEFGFEFSIEEIEGRALELKPDLFAEYWAEQAAKERKIA
jgi:hypothetical protein